MMKKMTFLLLCFLILISLTTCANNSNVESGISEPNAEISGIFSAQSESSPTVYPKGSTLIETTDSYREYLMNVEIAVMIQDSYANFVSEDHERYSYVIYVPLELEIKWPTMFEAGNEFGDYSKVADIIVCVKLREGEIFSDAFEIGDDNFYVQEGYYTQLDKGSYQGPLENVIYYSVIKYSGVGEYGGGEYKYNYGFLVELEDDIAAHVTFYSTNDNRAEAEAYYRSIVETIQKV